MTQQLDSLTNQIRNHEPSLGNERFTIPTGFHLEGKDRPDGCGPGEIDPPTNTGGGGTTNSTQEEEEAEATEQGGDVYTQSD